MQLTIHHICIQTDCYEASLDFYRDILGFKLIKESPDFHGRYYNSWLQLDDFLIELQTGKGGEELSSVSTKSNGIVHVCFYVDDMHKAYESIVEKGYTSFRLKNGEAIYTVEDGKLFKVVAPEGTIIEFRNSYLPEEIRNL